MWTWPPRKPVIGRTKKGTLLLRTEIVDELKKAGQWRVSTYKRRAEIFERSASRFPQVEPASTCFFAMPLSLSLEFFARLRTSSAEIVYPNTHRCSQLCRRFHAKRSLATLGCVV